MCVIYWIGKTMSSSNKETNYVSDTSAPSGRPFYFNRPKLDVATQRIPCKSLPLVNLICYWPRYSGATSETDFSQSLRGLGRTV